MAASDVGSWLEVDPQTDGSCCSRLNIFGAQALTWWRDTTDPVVLNSPWLRRGTGRFFRALFTLGQIGAWLFVLLPDPAVMWASNFPETTRGMSKDIPLFALMAICLALSSGTSLWTSRESFRGSMFFGIGCAISIGLLARRDSYFSHEFSFVIVIAVMCHCNVHPAVLLLVVAYHFLYISVEDLIHSGQTLLTCITVMTFECTMLVALTWDFTLRVKAVCSGVLFGENDEVLESPLAGRSARSVCWVSGVNQWIFWAATMIHNSVESTRKDEAFLRNHIPVSSVAVPFLAVGLVVLALCDKPRTSGTSFRSSVWQGDFAMAFFCCAPAVLLMVNLKFSHIKCKERKTIYWHDFTEETIRRSLLLCTTGVQTLIQAGCHPMICAAAAASLTATSVSTSPLKLVDIVQAVENRDALGRSLGSIIVLSPVFIETALAWFLVVSHVIDFFSRMRAIERGMQQSRQNAASSQRFLTSERDGVELPVINQEVLYCEDPSLEDVAAPSGPSKRGPSTVVAVVRHAERADNMQTFDAWGCSKDAENFPHDPPITARGAEQAEQLADELKMKEMAFEVIVSSPFLRCLQTALILAEKFDAKVLIDQDLGEVMGPPVFETKPPLPPRPWRNLKATLKASAISASSHERLRAGRLMGKGPQWKESLQQARLRYVKRYLDYLRRARHTKKNCLLVTHGHMVQACASVLPVNQHRKIVSVDYCGAAVAECYRLGKNHNHPDGCPPARALSFDSGKHQAEKEEHVQSPFDEKNELIQDAKIRYWTLFLRGVRTVPAATPSGSRLPGLSADLGQSWQDLVKLLGVLPPVAPPSAPLDSHSESVCSFGTRTNTTVSMNMIRQPDSAPKSPKNEHCVTVLEKTETQNEPRAPSNSVAPKLKPLTSGLAARRGFSKSKVPATVVEDQV